ncbi:MAG TPA: hypothetical protein VF294_15040, partial [Polyangiaceae bacterium]
FAVERGFHVLAPAYDANFNIVINDADYYGDARREELDGLDHTSHYAARDGQPAEQLGLSPADGVEHRVRFGLAYLAANFPDEDWDYFLTADGEVRWSDVILTGTSHGASGAARFAMILKWVLPSRRPDSEYSPARDSWRPHCKKDWVVGTRSMLNGSPRWQRSFRFSIG